MNAFVLCCFLAERMHFYDICWWWCRQLAVCLASTGAYIVRNNWVYNNMKRTIITAVCLCSERKILTHRILGCPTMLYAYSPAALVFHLHSANSSVSFSLSLCFSSISFSRTLITSLYKNAVFVLWTTIHVATVSKSATSNIHIVSARYACT